MSRRWPRGDAGAGLVSTFIGASIFLVFLLFAAQLLLGLYLTSVVTAVTYDAAQRAAGAGALGSPAARADAVESARRSLGAVGARASFAWSVDADAVRLTVRVPRPPLLPGLGLVQRPPLVRTVRVRTERVR